ncbi:hypothetical protein [Allobranchiibius sp. GilTou73]|uniref:hypothetical protein n=1 Tax=Allobranchiibius sp. GilTou73 TaxID=2904523 RepID=UPI001F3FC7CF|nr:hypothetical protein [Allobranchiibius sp. GilTou73]UIJ33815.1 hypothetical protein LVQ62_11715 [Allobranchiibius sp. GilTou73]
MYPWGWIAIALAVLALIAWYLSYSAARLDRLHGRVEGSLSALDAQLVRRAETSMELANSGLLDPASSMLLADAAGSSLDASDATEVSSEVQEHGVDQQRATIETDLTITLLAVLTPETVVQEGVLEYAHLVQQAGARVQLARRFHDDAVRDVRRVRAKPVVRLFRLAGRTHLPQMVQFDDRIPQTD